MNNETFDVNEAIKAQAKLCKEKNYPDFAPSNGICWCCNRNIYQQIGWKNECAPSGMSIRKIRVPASSPEVQYTTGISVEEAGDELVTGCPHCNRTYCD